ncbi:hypothetical protein [Limosilactobacillus vaginalis]|uniref:hypothetical protein n=1 Tax=Limosilactobacillus vaginalis TaxID=1633 RepID=UPI001DB42F3F|nr:hypothetical protein [Limosilactobacillus vaginalis]HJG17652.1 hypothetical protein [Limosilactobacillus vaginalis]
MASNTHIYLMQEDESGEKRTVYPVTDVNAIIGLGDKQGDLLTQIKDINKRLTALEKKVNYY